MADETLPLLGGEMAQTQWDPKMPTTFSLSVTLLVGLIAAGFVMLTEYTPHATDLHVEQYYTWCVR